MVVRLKQFTPFTVQVIPQASTASQANPEVTFNGQWLTEKISDNSLIEIRVNGRGIVTDNHSAKVRHYFLKSQI